MNIVVLQENLFESVNLLGKILPSRTTISALQSILLKAEKNTISATANDLEKTATITIPGKIEDEGQLLLPGKTSLSLLSSFPQEKIRIHEQEEGIELTGGKFRVVLKGEKPGSFPLMEQKTGGEITGKIKRTILEKIVKTVAFSASSDQTRLELTGVLIEGTSEGLSAAATDGFRLSYLKVAEGLVGTIPAMIVPANALSLVLLFVKGEDEFISFSVNEEKTILTFMSSGVVFSVRLIEGTFPDFKKIIPTQTATKITVSRESLVQAVRFSSVFAREAANVVRLSISGDRLVLSANAPQTGKNQSEISVEKEGEDVDTAFNFRFLLDFLAVSSADRASFEINGPLSPGLFRFVQDEDFLHVVMPVRLQGAE